jgi:hypothetical protein
MEQISIIYKIGILMVKKKINFNNMSLSCHTNLYLRKNKYDEFTFITQNFYLDFLIDLLHQNLVFIQSPRRKVEQFYQND